jgi:hypothetical protein
MNMGKIEAALPRETKAAAMHRLQREGQWEEASAYRREVRQQQRSLGKTKREAGEIAWPAMMEKFPPLEQSEIPPDVLDELLRQSQGQQVDPVGIITWTCEHLTQQDVKPSDAPTLGAWGLLQWAKAHSDAFFTRLFPLALKPRRKTPASEDHPALQKKSLQELAISLEAFWQECRESWVNQFGLPKGA